MKPNPVEESEERPPFLLHFFCGTSCQIVCFTDFLIFIFPSGTLLTDLHQENMGSGGQGTLSALLIHPPSM